MFKHYERAMFLDLSSGLRGAEAWDVGALRGLYFHLDVCTLAIEPSAAILAVGTSSGMVHIFGGPGVELTLIASEGLRIKFLQFAVSVYKLICVDERNRLHVWDLTSYGRPKLQMTARFGSVTALSLSPSHTHAFLSLESGEIKTYDLLCLQKSPYTIPNMWTLYEKKLSASGAPPDSNPSSRVPVDLVIHPRDLKMVFVAYGGGIVLSDLTQRNTVRAYELTLPPGAPGGAGYEHHDLLTYRRPSVTAFAIHPAGHFFAVGYTDGSIAFWDVEDEDQPLSVRTIEEVDVHVVDGTKLEKHVHSEANPKTAHVVTPHDREPIFKLAWSAFSTSTDPRGGETALTILGGAAAGGASGVTVLWMPAFNPPEAYTVTGPQTAAHRSIRAAMRQSVLTSKSFNYYSSGVVQDFLLIPRDSPHFSGSFDPTSILLLTEANGKSRAVEAFRFPPPAFSPTTGSESDLPSSALDADSTSDVLSQDLASTLDAMRLDQDPERTILPCPLWSGTSGVVGGQIVKVERDAHRSLISGSDDNVDILIMRGGFAWSDETKAADYKLAKWQPHRILVTYHADLSIRFQDISPQVLIAPHTDPITHRFPEPLPSLTIDLIFLLSDPLVATQLHPTFIDKARFGSVELATESLECVIVFTSGEVMIYRLNTGQQRDTVFREAPDKEIIILEHLPRDQHKKFYPYLMLAPGRGPVITSAISDIGFFAVSYADGSLFVLDMRGPSIILRFGHDTKSKHRQAGLHLRHHSDASELISCLTWTVCGLNSDPVLHIRLLAVSASGLAYIFTFVRSGSTWITNGEPRTAEASASPIANGSFILDAKTGALWKATPDRLGASLQAGQYKNHCLWVTSGVKGVRCLADIDGEKLGKADWGNKVGIVRSVQIVERDDSVVLVAFTQRQEALVYSLPDLEYLHTFHLPQITTEPISADQTGGFIQLIRHSDSGLINQITLGTLFNLGGIYDEPAIDFASTRVDVSPQPQPVAVGPATILSSLSSWVPFGQGMTGVQIDALLAGPNRPLPVEPEPQPPPTASDTTTGGSLASSITESNLYDRLSSALSERGEKLGNLQEHFKTLEEGTSAMAAQAKRIAAEQTAKSWFKFG